MFLKKKQLNRFVPVSGSLEARVSGGPAAQALPGGSSRPRLRAQALRIRASGSLSEALSLSLPEALFPTRSLSELESPWHAVTRNGKPLSPGPGPPAPRPRAASLINIVTSYEKLE